ncbi:MAG: twin-arginine translocation signal domain-containing protein, partial [Comamonadaceae bacterium]
MTRVTRRGLLQRSAALAAAGLAGPAFAQAGYPDRPIK